jgi:hypothetical protein
MYSPKRSLFLATALLFSSQVSYAQTEQEAYDPGKDAALIEKGLNSTLPLQVAVSAYRAKQDSFRLPKWGPQLRQAVVRSASLQPEAEAIRTRRIILDALIQSDTSAPLDELLPFFSQFPAAVIALLDRSNNANLTEDRIPLLIAAEGMKNRLYWSAAASLVDRKRLVHHLAQQVWFDYPIYLTDSDFVPILIFGGGPGGVPGGSPGSIIGGVPNGRVGWPEEIAYHLSKTGRQIEALPWSVGEQTYLIASPSSEHHVGARGDQPDADPKDWDEHARDIQLTLVSFRYCGLCSYSRGDNPRIRGGKAYVFWRSEDETRRSLTEGIEQYVAECKDLLNALGETGFSDVEIRSKVRIWIHDWRKSRTIPIPTISVGVQINLCQDSMAGYCGR